MGHCNSLSEIGLTELKCNYTHKFLIKYNLDTMGRRIIVRMIWMGFWIDNK